MNQQQRRKSTAPTHADFKSSDVSRIRRRTHSLSDKEIGKSSSSSIEIISSDDEEGVDSLKTQAMGNSQSTPKLPSTDDQSSHSSSSYHSATGETQVQERHTNTKKTSVHQDSQDGTLSLSDEESSKERAMSSSPKSALDQRHNQAARLNGDKGDMASPGGSGSGLKRHDQEASMGTLKSKLVKENEGSSASRNRDKTTTRSRMPSPRKIEGQPSRAGPNDVIDLLSSDEDENDDDRSADDDRKPAAKSRPLGASAGTVTPFKSHVHSNMTKKEKKRVQPVCLQPGLKAPPSISRQTTSRIRGIDSADRRSDSDDVATMLAATDSPNFDRSASKPLRFTKCNQRKVSPKERSLLNNRKISLSSSISRVLESNMSISPTRATTFHELKSRCWKCSVLLRMDETSEEMCCYAMHTHPLFEVPICCVCSSEVAAVEADHDVDQEEDTEFCSGCGSHEDELELLFLCDKCKRGMCPKCVSQAHGGGAKGDAVVTKLTKEDGSWFGPCCLKPFVIKKLKEDMERYAEQEAPERSDEQVLRELDIVESKKRECEEWDNEENLRDLEARIRDELTSSMKEGFDIDWLEEEVASEMERWHKQMEQHEERLADLAASLQEELSRRNVDLKAFYEKIGLLDSGPAEEEPWKRAADEEISKRELERKQQPPEDSSDADSDADSLEGMEVEDLWDDFPDDDADADFQDAVQRRKADGWRNSDRATKRQIEKSLRKENERYFNRIKVKKVAETEDAVEIDKEETETFSSVSKVRRDDLVEKPRRKERTLVQNKRRRSSGVSRPSKTRKYEGVQDKTDRSHPQLMDVSSEPPPVDDVNVLDFLQSSLILSGPNTEGTGQVAIAAPLARLLKKHQREGIDFMWKATFSDLVSGSGKASPDGMSGAILAHNMGLGKSLSSVALIETLLNSPALKSPGKRGLIHTILLVVPVNTLSNWENEFNKWTGRPMRARQTVELFGLQGVKANHRNRILESWARREQTLLATLKRTEGAKSFLQNPGPCAIFIDEAHSMLKNSTNEVYKALAAVKTKRRICLTGSPFQNDLGEYYRLVNFVCPRVFGDSERKFNVEFAEPIRKGLVSDAPLSARNECEDLLQTIEERVAPYVHRKKDCLQETLPPMQEVTLFIRKSTIQAQLVSAYKGRIQSSQYDCGNLKNFFAMYQANKVFLNHPACLMMSRQDSSVSPDPLVSKASTSAGTKPSETSKLPPKIMPCKDGVIELISDSDMEMEPESESVVPSNWWTPVVEKYGEAHFEEVESGYKVPLLLHILVAASNQGEKCVVFSQCLKTLSFLEQVLGMEEWEKHVPSLSKSFPGQKNGSWKMGRDFLRLDGSSQADERGMMIGDFNSESNDRIRLFLISLKAGGLGINLCSASRVILFDTHFNPVLSNQAWHRTYRLGQEKPVFVYRFITQGTMEEKIYKKAENKTNLGERVIDSKNFMAQFSRKEVEDLAQMNDWVQCDDCEKWRMIPPSANVDLSKFPDRWCCEMNEWDSSNNKCSDPERDDAYYARHFSSVVGETGTVLASPFRGKSSVVVDETKEKLLLARDTIMQKLIKISAKDKKSKIVSKFKYGVNTRLDEAPSKILEDLDSMEGESVAAWATSSKRQLSFESPARKKPIPPTRKSPRKAAVMSPENVDDIFADLQQPTRRKNVSKGGGASNSVMSPENVDGIFADLQQSTTSKEAAQGGAARDRRQGGMEDGEVEFIV